MMRPRHDIKHVYLCVAPIDFRRAINGLSQVVQSVLELDPFGEALYVFTNRDRDKIKILYWERNGFCLWQKRLERERFKWPTHVRDGTVTLDGEMLNWLLDGFDLWRSPPHKTLFYRSA